MNEEQIRQLLIASLKSVAPELLPAAVDPNADLRDEYDLDSMDFMRFVRVLHERSGLTIPEADYGQLATLARAQRYFSARLLDRQ
jgi:acyl carrier protein